MARAHSKAFLRLCWSTGKEQLVQKMMLFLLVEFSPISVWLFILHIYDGVQGYVQRIMMMLLSMHC